MALILLIDDDDFYRSVLRQILEDAGHRVIEASGGQEGLELFETQRPELVVTDMRMPGFDGGEVIRRLREMSPIARILALSGAATSDVGTSLESAKQVGANGILSKLGPIDDILATVDEILATDL